MVEKKIAGWKKETVRELEELIKRYPVIGVINISEFPARQFQGIREKLRDQAKILVAKNTLVKIAIEKAAREKDPKLVGLVKYLKGEKGFIFTDMDPFKLNRILIRSKMSAPAKPGSKSPRDIVIPAGETDLPPGPAVGELQRVGIKARIQAGKVTILEDCHLVKAGDVISSETASVLNKLGIQPLELGTSLLAAYQGGTMFTGDVLTIDEQKIFGEFQLAYLSAVNLSLNSGYPTKSTVGVMLAKAEGAARSLAINALIFVPEVMPALLTRAISEMLGVASAVAGNERALEEKPKQLIGGQSTGENN